MRNLKKIKYLTDSNGTPLFLKLLVIQVIGFISYFRYRFINRLRISGTENLEGLPQSNVLFVSNHQTYFADVAAFYHIISAHKNGYKNNIKNPFYLLNPRVNIFYIAARETMKSGLLAKILTLGGAVMVDRTWRSKGKDIKRSVNMKDSGSVSHALKDGWVITFPQGTTKPFMPGRKGTAHIIKNNNPIVIPVVIDGFRRAFDKKGLFFKKKGTDLKVKFKAPLKFDTVHDTVDEIMAKIMKSIEQDDSFNQMIDAK